MKSILLKINTYNTEIKNQLAKTITRTLNIRQVSGWRALIKDKEVRFFLAVILNCPNKDAAFNIIGSEFPNQSPIELIIAWLKKFVVDMNIDNLPYNEEVFPLLESVVRGYTVEETISSLAEEYDIHDNPDAIQKITKIYKQIKTDSVFSTLFM